MKTLLASREAWLKSRTGVRLIPERDQRESPGGFKGQNGRSHQLTLMYDGLDLTKRQAQRVWFLSGRWRNCEDGRGVAPYN